MHDVQRPAAVGFCRQIQRLAGPIWQTLFGSSRQVQSHIAIHSMDAFLVPAMAVKPQPGTSVADDDPFSIVRFIGGEAAKELLHVVQGDSSVLSEGSVDVNVPSV